MLMEKLTTIKNNEEKLYKTKKYNFSYD